jgi:hypothetical protein
MGWGGERERERDKSDSFRCPDFADSLRKRFTAGHRTNGISKVELLI